VKRLAIEVRPRQSGLLVGGRTDSKRGADDATARDLQGRLVLPASALRGALRIELERLLRGRGATACRASGPRDPDDRSCTCPICRLFGSEGAGTGTLRLDDARLIGKERIVDLRPRIAVGRKTGTVSHQLLGFADTGEVEAGDDGFFRATASIVPLDAGDEDGALEQDVQYLAAACRALGALGGGKSRGLGWVDCQLVELPERAVEAVRPPAGDSLSIRFEAVAPLLFGSGRPLGYFHPTLRHAPASTVRGALAFALLEQGIADAGEPGFQTLFGPHAAASFGSARPAGDLPSATRRKCRPQEHLFDDLVGEIVRREAAACGVALAARPEATCPVAGCVPAKVAPAPEGSAADALVLRLHTRTAINRRTGTSLDARLFSVELVEPWLAGDEERPLVLRADLHGLVPEAAELLARLDGRQVSLGGKRSQGLGRCDVSLGAAAPASVDDARAAVEELDRELRAAWGDAAGDAGLPAGPLPEHQRPVAVVLTEPWTPAQLQDLARGPLPTDPRHAFVAFHPVGRFGAVEAHRWQAGDHVEVGELPPTTAAQAGSTWVYWIDADVLERRLGEWLGRGRHGEGPLGEGRFLIRGAADPAATEEMKR
jgi:CRISPR/Cas system CSM-associated protein Csm3 (group 7 of RAMP superfamily)